MVSCVAIAINVGFSLIASYGIPLILATGLDIKYATLIFSISSILSFLLQGFLGTSSDHCTGRWGRRRPFIVTFSVLTIIGLILASFSFYFGLIPIKHSTILVAGCVYVGIILCDFSVGVLQLPSRAYLLDVISAPQAEIANFIYSAMFGIGTIIGTLLGAMKWSLLTHQPVTVPHQAQIVYALASVVITVCMLIAVCSVKERTYNGMLEKRPLINDIDEDIEDVDSIQQQKSCFKRFVDPFLDIFIFLPKMSMHMWLLWVMTFCSFLGLVFFNSYVTLYVGTVVYGGDPHANHTTAIYQRYATGVHTGTWALFLAAITNTISSLTLNFIIKLVSLKTIFLISTALYCVGTCLLIYFHQLPVVFTVGAIYGVYLGLTLTVPYVLIPIYKVSSDDS